MCTVQVFQLFCVQQNPHEQKLGKVFKKLWFMPTQGHTKKVEPHKTRSMYLMITSTSKHRGRKNKPSICFHTSSTRGESNCKNIELVSQLGVTSFHWDHLHRLFVSQLLWGPRWSPAPQGAPDTEESPDPCFLASCLSEVSVYGQWREGLLFLFVAQHTLVGVLILDFIFL